MCHAMGSRGALEPVYRKREPVGTGSRCPAQAQFRACVRACVLLPGAEEKAMSPGALPVSLGACTAVPVPLTRPIPSSA